MTRRPIARLDDGDQARIRRQASDGVSYRDIGANFNIGVRVVAKVIEGTYVYPGPVDVAPLPRAASKRTSIYTCGDSSCVKNLHRALCQATARRREYTRLQVYVATLVANNDPVLLDEFQAIKRRCEKVLGERNRK